MIPATRLWVNVRLPGRLLYRGEASHVFAVAENGAFGILPNHADHVTSLVPSVLVLREEDGQERFFGIEQGLLVKRGHEIEIAVHWGVQGDNLETLSDTVAARLEEADEDERKARTALSRLEVGIVRQFGELHKPGWAKG